MQKHIIIVDDDIILAEMLSEFLDGHGYKVSTIHTAAGLIDHLNDLECDLIVTDRDLPDLDGMEIVRQIRHRQLPVPIVVMSGTIQLDRDRTSKPEHPMDFINKPFLLSNLLEKIEALLE